MADITAGPATRELLMKNIAEVFASRGYDGATLANLASAAGLSKASLYHHFPGGKPEMAAALLHQAIQELEQLAFAALAGDAEPRQKLRAFIKGVLPPIPSRGSATACSLCCNTTQLPTMGRSSICSRPFPISFRPGTKNLTRVFETAGAKPKRARRQAHDLIAALYGALFNARLHGDAALFIAAIKRLRKQF